jgi:GDPmannose 4,6-dehydratase
MKTALITGVNGMDGSHLADLLLEKGYHVCGITRSQVTLNEKVTYYRGDINDINFVYKTILNCNPDEIYHLAAISYHEDYWNDPLNTYMVDSISSVYFLEAIRAINPKIKFLNTSSSEIYGLQNGAMDENS